MFKLSISTSRLSRSSQKNSPASSVSPASSMSPATPSSALSLPRAFNFRRNSSSSQSTLATFSSSYAEDMDDDNLSWGPVRNKKASS